MKKLALTIALASSVIFAAENAHAASEIQCDTPKSYVQSVNDVVTNTILDKDKSDADKTKILADLLVQNIDTQWIGRFVLGNNWRALNPEQQKAYLQAYEDYLVATYVPIFKDYRGEKVEYISAKPLKRKEEYLLATKITRVDEPEVQVSYRIQKKGECYRVYDIVAEGVSMLNTQRQDFSSIYTRKGYDELMKILKNKVSIEASPVPTATVDKRQVAE